MLECLPAEPQVKFRTRNGEGQNRDPPRRKLISFHSNAEHDRHLCSTPSSITVSSTPATRPSSPHFTEENAEAEMSFM